MWMLGLKGLIKGQKAGTCLGLQGSYSFLDLKFKTFSKQYFIFPDARLTNRCSISRPWKTQETSFFHDAPQMYGNQGATWTYNVRELWNFWNFSFCDWMSSLWARLNGNWPQEKNLHLLSSCCSFEKKKTLPKNYFCTLFLYFQEEGGWIGKRNAGFWKLFLPGFRIQSEILTDFRILQLQRIEDSSILDFACNSNIFAWISDSGRKWKGGFG